MCEKADGRRGGEMARTIGIGIQAFDDIRKNDYFYIDKTHFIERGQCYADNQAAPFWKDFGYEYDRTVLFCGICRQGGFV